MEGDGVYLPIDTVSHPRRLLFTHLLPQEFNSHILTALTELSCSYDVVLEVKLNLLLCLCHEDVWGNEGINPRICILGTDWR
jgi:hypothetical protein